ncbi:YvcK family protein [Patescibacteria group bacterium]|nr:YvcK family protein [Patescibacteria group bacterium]
MSRKKKIVVIGGGTGTYQVLSGLKTYPHIELSAVISMCDSGGSTGRLRKELGILPPGDIRRAILALSDLPFARKTLEEVFDFRFENGKTLAGHSLGNILLAALVQITGSMDRAIKEAARILNASGKIFPITLDNTNLVAILKEGTRVFGETKIDRRKIKPKVPIEKVYISPKANIFYDAAKAIEAADLIVFGPGDLYTSLIPTLLVNGTRTALSKSNAKVVFVVNLMTKKGETDGFVASDFVKIFRDYMGEAAYKLTHVIVNKKLSGEKSRISSWYRKYGSIPVKDDLSKTKKKEFKVISGNYVGTTTFFRHSPEKLAKVIISLL